MVVVPSAMSGETNRLLGLASELAPSSAKTAYYRELDMLASTGEQASSALLAIALQAEGLEAISFRAGRFPCARTAASPRRASSPSMTSAFAPNSTLAAWSSSPASRVLIPTVTSPRSAVAARHSAVAVAAALKAAECLIYTDVDGVYTTDPRVVQAAKRLNTVSFEEMLEMASLGPGAANPLRGICRQVRCPCVLSSFTPWDIDLEEESTSGTLITFEEDENGKGRRIRHRIQPRRSQDLRSRRARHPWHRLRHPGPGGRRQHRSRCDHPEHQQGRQNRLQLHRQPGRLPARHGTAA